MPPALPQERPKFIGILNPLSSEEFAPYRDVFVRALLARGYTMGTHFVLIERFANGKDGRLSELAKELASLKVDILVTLTTNGVLAAERATNRIPIVFAEVGDPLLGGFADSLARPGRNITGVTNFSGDLNPKRLQLLQEIVPSLTRVAVLSNSNNLTRAIALQRLQASADQLGLQLSPISVGTQDEIEPAFRSMVRQRAQAVVVLSDIYFWGQRRLITESATKSGLPSMFAAAAYAEAGGLVSYGIDGFAPFEQVAGYVDRILKGARPGDLPIEEPTRVELVINQKTAEALSLKIPKALLLQAEKVID
jgi:putative ABC transport system substrate-binding protein